MRNFCTIRNNTNHFDWRVLSRPHDHLLTDDKNIEEILSSEVNWDIVDSRLAELRKDSEEFLSEALKS